MWFRDLDHINTSRQSKMQASEMKFLRLVKRCTRLDHLTNNFICSNLKIYSIYHKIIDYQHKWKEHVEQMDKKRLSRKLVEYKPEDIEISGDSYLIGLFNGAGTG